MHHYKAIYDVKSKSVTISSDFFLHDHSNDVNKYDVTAQRFGGKKPQSAGNEYHWGSLKSPLLYKDVDGKVLWISKRFQKDF